MPFTAICKGRRVNSLLCKESEWEELKESERGIQNTEMSRMQGGYDSTLWYKQPNTSAFRTPF